MIEYPLVSSVHKNVRRLFSWDAPAILIILVGAILRLRQYLANRSLWCDEAMLANNVITRGYGELVGALQNNQACPPGFLWVVKTIGLFAGYGEYPLRFFSLVAGVSTLALVYLIGREIMGRLATLCCLALVAVHWSLIYYSSELKQYSGDAMWCALLVWLCLRTLNGKAVLRNGAILLISSLAGGWFSHPAWFFIPVIWLVTYSRVSDPGQGSKRWPWFAAVCIMLNLAVLYWFSLRYHAGNPVLNRFWADALMPLPPWRDMGWFVRRTAEFMRDPLEMPSAWLTALLAVAVAMTMLKNWRHGLLFIGPVVLAVVASGFGLYAIKGRLLVFLIPMTMIILCYGIEYLTSFAQRLGWGIHYFILLIVVAAFIIPSTSKTIKRWRYPEMRVHSRPLLVHI